jgi:small subunit ribosomal protein S27e
MKDFVQMPKSKYMRVICKKCKSDQMLYNKIASVVKCNKCGAVLAEPTGGQARILAKVVEVLS